MELEWNAFIVWLGHAEMMAAIFVESLEMWKDQRESPEAVFSLFPASKVKRADLI